MFKILSFICCVLILSGCTGKELKETGSAIGSSNAVGLLIALPIYGVGVLVENKENEEKKLQDEAKRKIETANVDKPMVEEIKTETTNVPDIKPIAEEIKTVETKVEVNQEIKE